MPREGYGKKDGSKKGWNIGGRGRNKTEKCRHPIQKNKKGGKKYG